jgi:hypothetical protein
VGKRAAHGKPQAQVNSIDNELKARLKGKSKQEILQMLKDLEID